MIQILNFIFSSFWTFIGTLLLISSIGRILVMMVAVIRGNNISIFGKED